jgi:uncharacterized protein (DUF1015 family)
MPEIQAFRGLRYNLAKVGSLGDIVAPPYDVIDGTLQDKLYERSEYNVIRLELNRTEPSDVTGEECYLRASRILRTWIRDGVIEAEGDPAIYVYHQEFSYAGQTYVRKGFMARVRLQRFGEGNIYPHEQTHAKAKDDRLKLTRATQTNLSQIFGLYPDPDNMAQEILEQHIITMRPLEAIDHLGVIHRVWPVTDPRIIGEVAALVCNLPMFVADGHHRYETACNYRDELAAQGVLTPEHPANYVLTMLIGMDDPGLLVLPTHRLLEGVPEMTASEICERVSSCFDCELAGEGPEGAAKIWKDMEEIDDQMMMALYSSQDRRWVTLTAKKEAIEQMAAIAPDHSAAWQGLGVAILHRLVFEELLSLRDMPKPTYVHLVDEVIAGLNGELEGQRNYPLAALVMPATIEHIREVSLHQERMPAKSTYFYPKLLSGLVLHQLD